MLLLVVKISTLLILLGFSLAIGRIPLLAPTHKSPFAGDSRSASLYGEALASGIFLGIAGFQLLPEAFAHVKNICPRYNYLLTLSLCLLITLALYYLEKRFSYPIASKKLSKPTYVYIMVGIMCLHALFTGAALGESTIVPSTIALLIAIYAHKGSECFAVAWFLKKNTTISIHPWRLYLLFSFMTPLGIAIGMLLQQTRTSTTSEFLPAAIHLLTASTLIYMGLFHSLPALLRAQKTPHSIKLLITFILSLTLCPFLGNTR